MKFDPAKKVTAEKLSRYVRNHESQFIEAFITTARKFGLTPEQLASSRIIVYGDRRSRALGALVGELTRGRDAFPEAYRVPKCPGARVLMLAVERTRSTSVWSAALADSSSPRHPAVEGLAAAPPDGFFTLLCIGQGPTEDTSSFAMSLVAWSAEQREFARNPSTR